MQNLREVVVVDDGAYSDRIVIWSVDIASLSFKLVIETNQVVRVARAAKIIGRSRTVQADEPAAPKEVLAVVACERTKALVNAEPSN